MNTDTKITQIQEKRQHLKKLSAIIKEKVAEGEFETVNEGLIDHYTDSKNHTFKTFHEWAKSGYKVKKGEKAYLIWGQPKRNKKIEQPQQEKDEDGYKFYPLCFLFSNAQVEKKGGSNE